MGLVARRLTLGVSGQALLAGFQEFLRQALIKPLGDPLAPAQRRDALLAPKPIKHDPDLLLGGILPPRLPADVPHRLADHATRGENICPRSVTPGFFARAKTVGYREFLPWRRWRATSTFYDGRWTQTSHQCAIGHLVVVASFAGTLHKQLQI